MSLRVWLPLDGNFNNQGLDNFNFFNIDATVSTSGKIGKCYSFNGSTSRIYANNVSLPNDVFSCVCWVYPTNAHSTSGLILCLSTGDVTGPSQQFGLYLQSNYIYINGNGSQTKTNTTLTLNTWYHLCFTIDGSTTTFYVNGQLAQTYTNANKPKVGDCLCIGARSGSASGAGVGFKYPFQGSINDIRIYDHCLSPLEVKELSQGLILHYPLNNQFYSDNLILNGFGDLGATNWTSSSNISTTELPPNSTAVESFYGGNMNQEYIPILPTHSYTISAYIKSSGGTSGNTYPSIFPYDIDKKFIGNLHTLDGFISNTLTTLAQALNPGDTTIYATDLSQWNTASGQYGNYCAVFSYKDSTGHIYPDLEYTQNTPVFGSGTSEKVNINKTNNTITLTSAYTGPAMPAGTSICQSRAGSTYYYPFGGIALSTLSDWTFKTATLTPINVNRLKAARYFIFSTYGSVYMAEIKLVDNTLATNVIKDCSGYGHDGTIVARTGYEAKSSRYEKSIRNGNDYLLKSTVNLPSTQGLTVSFWIYINTWGAQYSGLFAFSEDASNPTDYTTVPMNQYDSGVALCPSTGSYARVSCQPAAGAWHHCVITHDGTNAKYYEDGVLKNTSSTISGSLKPATYLFIGYSKAGGVIRKTYANWNDFRVYVTALSADDVKTLYDTSASIDNLGNFHSYEFTEDEGKSIGKNGIAHTSEITEFDVLSKLKYDTNVYIEPDGSAWVHIYHHNNPAAGSFASTDTFATSVYKDENRWFNATEICNALDKWEFMIKYAYTPAGTAYKERWVQTVNPELAVFEDVDAADITRNTSDGYRNYSWGGLYKKASSAYWVLNNGKSGNWWGATGSYSIYQGGIPGYGGTITTTGYNDLYVRIDNVTLSNLPNASVKQNGIFLGNEFIEK